MTENNGVPQMAPPVGGAVVRMYCTGLGDCFLIGFRAADGKTSYVLIDCGVWKGAPGASLWMRRIMKHIRDEVAGRGIDLLVATHQHWDHLSGFHQAKDLFEEIDVKQVWLPWTENPQDGTAVRLAEERRMAYRATVAAISRLQAFADDKQRDKKGEIAGVVDHLEAVLQFAGYEPGSTRQDSTEKLLGLLGAGPGTEELMEIVRKKVARPSYIRPSLRPLSLDGVPDVRIYPLGPPTDLKLLGRDNPSTVPGKSEVYLAPGMPHNEDFALFSGVTSLRAAQDGGAVLDPACPFDRWQSQETDNSMRARYEDSRTAWRRIDTDWLAAAGQLALDFDDHLNNTSLALAFELGEGGPVLLFPGDAQVGNWLSWHELKSDNGLTAESLLNRTVLYKVGHHASHNATLKDKGLKMMTDTTRLVAMIPVDEEEAHKPKGRNKNGWAMPYDKLLTDLQVRTESRILRADKGQAAPAAGLSSAQLKRWNEFDKSTLVENATIDIQGKTVTRPLLVQYTVEG